MWAFNDFDPLNPWLGRTSAPAKGDQQSERFGPRLRLDMPRNRAYVPALARLIDCDGVPYDSGLPCGASCWHIHRSRSAAVSSAS